MPNGGHICCEYCTYGRSETGKCDIFGVETDPFTLCRAFRRPKQSHQDARQEWPILEELQPGVVYQIDNAHGSSGNPRPIYKVIRLVATN